jgi:hypothetical protein
MNPNRVAVILPRRVRAPALRAQSAVAGATFQFPIAASPILQSGTACADGVRFGP